MTDSNLSVGQVFTKERKNNVEVITIEEFKTSRFSGKVSVHYSHKHSLGFYGGSLSVERFNEITEGFTTK